MKPSEVSVRGTSQRVNDQMRPLCQPRFVHLLFALFLCAVMLVFVAPAHAQEEAVPTMTEARVAVDMSQDNNNSVEARYTIEGTDGLEDSMVEHLLVRQPGAEFGEISVENGSSGQAELSEGEGISRYRVPVSGDPATYTLRYEVRTDPQTFTVPIPVPDVAVAQPPDSNIEIETLLPEGESLTGEVFPSVSSVETRDGRQVLIQREDNVPSRVVAQYGEKSMLGISTFTSAAAVTLFGVILIFWYRRTFGGESQ